MFSTQKELCGKLLSTKVKAKSSFVPFFGHLGIAYTVHLWLVGKGVDDFLLVLIEHFSLAVTAKPL